MRLSLLTLLLLSASSPAFAMAEPDEVREVQPAPRAERPRAERSAEAPRVERPRFERQAESREAPPERSFEPRARRADAAPAFERRERRSDRAQEAAERPAIEPVEVERPAPGRDVLRNVPRERAFGGERPRLPPEVGSAPPPRDGVAAWRERQDGRRSRNRDIPPAAGSPVFGDAVQTPQTVTRPNRDVSIGSIAAEGVRNDRLRDRREAERWRQDWRRDRRYDWRSYRDRDRARFHIGIYIDPFGWNYRDWDIGWRLPSRYYASTYWIRDPWMYRLPNVYGPYRWIRYHQDVLLIDLRDGRVVDRIRYFFW